MKVALGLLFCWEMGVMVIQITFAVMFTVRVIVLYCLREKMFMYRLIENSNLNFSLGVVYVIRAVFI